MVACRRGPRGEQANVSLLNDITGAVGYRPQGQGQPTPAAGQQPGGPNAAASLANRFQGVFRSTFRTELATQFERGASGEFDDPALRLQEQAALARFREAQQAAASATPHAPSPTIAGAAAAPDAQPATPGTSPTGPVAPGAGTGGGTGAANGAATVGGGAAATSAAGVAEQRELYAIRVRNSEARLANIASKLNSEYPAAAALASASTGTWDPEAFVPKTRAQAEAFAQRMVIDATEAAARLDIVANQRDAARLEASVTGSPAAVALVEKLDADFARQKAYVDKLARIVDTASSGTLTAAGTEALTGGSLRDIDDLPAAELAVALRRSGMDEASVRRVVGAGELAVEEEQSPGGSVRLQKVAKEAADWTWVNRFNLQAARRREERAIEQRRIEEDRRVDEKRADRRASERRQARRTQDARVQEDRAEFSRYLQKLAAEAARGSAS